MDLFSGDAGRPAESRRDIYTVGRLNREARALLEAGLPSLWITGELSNLSRPASGHWYFTLKDEGAQVRCAMFRARNLAVRADYAYVTDAGGAQGEGDQRAHAGIVFSF